MIRQLWVVAATLLALPAWAAEVTEQALSLESRPGVTTAYYLTRPDMPPVAAAILLAGGEGSVGVRLDQEVPAPDPQAKGNFLVRTRRLLAATGILVATLDAPSDQGGSMTSQFRLSDEHVADIAALVANLRREGGGVPVWLIGTSMGTLSAARAAAALGGEIGGVILTSSITRAHRRYVYPPNGVFGLGLDKVNVPALVVAQAGDTCDVTPPADAPALAEAFTHSPRHAVQIFQGGGLPRSGSCEALAHHGFVGQEEEVVAAMAGFMMPAR